MRRVPIHLKLAGALAVPLLALAAVTVFEVARTSGERADVRRQTDLARAAIGPVGLVTTLQNERIWAPLDIFGLADQLNAPVESYEETRSQTDAAIADLQRRMAGNDTIAEAFGPALAGLDDLVELRASIDGFLAEEHQILETIDFGFDIFDRYTAMISPLYDAASDIARDVEDTVLRQGAELSDTVARGIEATTLLATVTIRSALLSEGGVDQPEEFVDISGLQASLARYTDDMAKAEGPYAAIPAGADAQVVLAGLLDQVDQAVSTGNFTLDGLFQAVNMPQGEGLFGYQDGVHEIINERADELDADAEARQFRLAALALATLLLAVVLSFVVSRSITVPLRSLTRQAKDLAGRRLPEAVHGVLDVPLGDELHQPQVEAVTVATRDEVADVADALNTVQSSVVHLAVDQAVFRRNIADLFVSLGGRNRSLLRRQLDLVTALESQKTDPGERETLAQLGHLATRMRRNAESLLALAGIDQRRDRTPQVHVEEVVRLALDEIEDMRPMMVHGLEPAAIVGVAAPNLIHLLAELIENALAFSPADRRVEIRGGRHPETGGYWLAVIDFGSGMEPEDVAAANRRLAGDESLRTAPTRHVGHFVAGHLARRAGVRVNIESSAGWGVVATIQVPPRLVVGVDAAAAAADRSVRERPEPHDAGDPRAPVGRGS